MLLNGFTLPHYLMGKGYLSVARIMDGRLSIHRTESRNQSFTVKGGEEDLPLFVKQVQGFESEKTETLRTEATCYWLANNEGEYALLKSFLPKFIEYDYHSHILITEGLTDNFSLYDYHTQVGKFPLELAGKQAELLASYHKDIFKTIQQGQSTKLFRRQVPVIFQLVQSNRPYWMSEQNPPERQMIKILRDHEGFAANVEAAQQSWKATSLVHGDIKPANFLLNKDFKDGAPLQLRLIDWETADLGDPAWDVAAIWQSYFFFWAYHQPNAAEGKSYGFALEYMQPSLQYFWREYISAMKFTDEESENFLQKSLQFCAFKLIHTCLESCQHQAQLSTENLRLLQLSLNLLNKPEEAVHSLLNL